MSLIDKAFKLRKKFVQQHQIGGGLGLLNRAESYLYLKNSETIEPFESITSSSKNTPSDDMVFFDESNVALDEIDTTPLESVDDNFENHTAGSEDSFSDIELEPVGYINDKNDSMEIEPLKDSNDIIVELKDFDDEPSDIIDIKESINEGKTAEENTEENKQINEFLSDNDFSEFLTEEPGLNEKKNLNKSGNSGKNFYEIANIITDELSKLNLKNDVYEDFNNILAENFGFLKSAMLVYSPDKQMFTHKASVNLDSYSVSNLSFDLKYHNIYKEVVKNNYLVIIDKDTFSAFKDKLSKNDLNTAEFILIMPFIMSNRIIGLFIGFKLLENRELNVTLINSLEIICKQNGALLYNIIQNEKK